jgi:enoyl-CoA hydratase/carnithine racemase
MAAFYDLVLDGPGKNSLGTKMIESILARLDAAKGEPVLFSGAGGVLSAGLDLKEVASLDVAGMKRFLVLVEELMRRIFDHPSPTVACVNGHAIAGGCVMTLCCDHRVMTTDERARIGLNEVALGLVFPSMLFRIVQHRVPPRALHEVTLRAGLHAPKDALRLGLVDELAEDPRATSEARITELAAHPRRAYVETKRALHEGVTAVSKAEYDAALETSLPTWTSDEVKQRVMARLKK